MEKIQQFVDAESDEEIVDNLDELFDEDVFMDEMRGVNIDKDIDYVNEVHNFDRDDGDELAEEVDSDDGGKIHEMEVEDIELENSAKEYSQKEKVIAKKSQKAEKRVGLGKRKSKLEEKSMSSKCQKKVLTKGRTVNSIDAALEPENYDPFIIRGDKKKIFVGYFGPQ